MSASVGLIGFGTVGQAVANLLLRRDGRDLRLVRVCTRPGGRPRPDWLPAPVGWTDRVGDLVAPDIDIFVELVGGLEEARVWAERALAAGKSVVTANKQLVAEHGTRLTALAASRGRQFLFEAAVAGGVPVIRAVRDGLAGDRLLRVAGVLNGTCNYILTRMERAGLGFSDALAEAQARGYAEADPSADIDGLDARAKLAILCAVGFSAVVEPRTIPCASIAGIGASDLKRALASGCTIRQVSRAERINPDGPGQPIVRASVGPELVPLDSSFARIDGCENVVVVTGETGGETTFAGQGAGGGPTAVAVVSDLLAIAGSDWRLAAHDAAPPSLSLPRAGAAHRPTVNPSHQREA